MPAEDYPGRYYHVKGTVEAFTELFARPEMSGVTVDPATVLATVKAYVKNPANEINPSIKSARQPVYSLKRAPVAASKRGQQKPKKLSIVSPPFVW